MMTSLSSKQKRAINIDIQHTLPIVKVIIFSCNTTSNPSIQAHNMNFAEILFDLSPGFLDGSFVCGVAFIGAEVRFWEAFFFYFGVDCLD